MSDTALALSRAAQNMRETISYWMNEWIALLKEQTASLFSPLSIPKAMAIPSGAAQADNSIGTPATEGELKLIGPSVSLGSAVALVFPDAEVLRPRLRLPVVSRRVMRQALVSEMHRVCPVDPAEVYFDFSTAKIDDRNVEIHLRVVRRRTIDEAMARCREAFLRVAEIRFDKDPKPADWRRFPVDRSALALAQWRRWRIAALTALTFVLAALLVFASYARNEAILSNLRRQIASAEAGARQSERLRAEIYDTAQIPAFLSQRKSASTALGILADITKLLPTDTWLTALEISDKKLRIQGYSRSASQLLLRIGSSRLLADPRFEAPLIQEAPGGPRRFDIVASVTR